MRKRLVMIAVCVGLVVPAHAQSIHKCVAEGKPVSFQSQPCGPGETTESVRTYVSDPGRPVRHASVPASGPVAAHARPRIRRVARRETGVVRNPCAEAKARRDAWERRVGLKRTYDELRQWNDTVARACD